MFAVELKRAWDNIKTERAEVCRLLMSIPSNNWKYCGNNPTGRAEASYDSVCLIVDHVSGGSGINTYDTVSVFARWAEGEGEFHCGEFSSEEFRLPNYIDKSNPAGSH